MFSQLFILILLILLNAFFASTEIAFISLNDAKISKLAKEGKKKYIQINKMLKEPSRFLATIQIGITLAGFLSSAFASDTFANKLAPILYNIFPNISFDFYKGFSIVIVTIILSYFTLVFGELVPKRIAMKNPEKVALFSINIIKSISFITYPFVNFLTFSTNTISKLFGVNEKDEETVTEEEILMMIDVGQENGIIEEQEKEMISNIFEFNDRIVAEIMTPRPDIFAIDINSDISKNIKLLDEYKYSRIPVYKDSIDEIIGILYIKDLIKALTSEAKFNLEELLKPVKFVPKTKMIDDLFKELQKNKVHLAIVLDEYGETAGVVTIEDILEEIVGNIFDEYDDIENEFEKIDENTYIISGGVSIYDLKKILKVEIPSGDYETLSGYLIENLGRIPNDDEHPILELNNITYKIEKTEDKRILWVKACKNS